MRTFFSNFLALLTVGGCATPQVSAPTPQPEEEKQPAPGSIPWAEGKAPSAAETTREVSAEPRTNDIAEEAVQEDGLAATAPSQACTGKAPPLLRSSVQIRADETRSCYDRVPESKKGAQGEVRVQIQVGVDGQVTKLQVMKDTFGVPEATRCIREILSKSFETRPRGGCALFVVPVQLAADETDGGLGGQSSPEEVTPPVP